jgi:hypothetical protein
MPIDIGGAGGASPVDLSWWDEEERKRRERLGIAGAPLVPAPAAPAPQPVQKTPEQQWRQQEQKPLEEQPREFWDSASARANQVIQRDYSYANGQSMGPIEEYHKLATTMGQQALTERIQAIKYIWDSYLPGVDGKDAIWQLVKSPLDMSMIQTMAKEGSLSRYAQNPDNPQAYKTMVSNYLGNDPVMSKLWLTADDRTVPEGTRVADYWKNDPSMAALTLASALSLGFGGPSQSIMTDLFSGEVVGAIVEAGAPAILRQIGAASVFMLGQGAYQGIVAGNKETDIQSKGPALDLSRPMNYLEMKLAEPLIKMGADKNDPMIKAIGTLNQLAYGAPAETVSAIVAYVQSDVKDPYTGAVILPAQGKGDVLIGPTGKLTAAGAQAILSRQAQIKSAEYDFKRELMRRNFQTDQNASFDMPLSSPVWKPAVDKYNSNLAQQNDLYTWYPEEAAYMDKRGFEWTKEGQAAANNQIWNKGIPNWPVEVAYQALARLGGYQEAMIAQKEFQARANRDPAYQEAYAKLENYANQQYADRYTKDMNPLELHPERKVMHLVRMDLAQDRGDLRNDANLVALDKALGTEAYRLISGAGGWYAKDYVGLLAETTGVGKDAWEKIRNTDPLRVIQANAAIDLAGVFAAPSIFRAIKGGNVGLASEAFNKSTRVDAAVAKAAGYMDAGDDAAAVQVMGGGWDAKSLVKETRRMLNNYGNPESYRGMAGEVYDAALKGDKQTIVDMMAGDAERASTVADLIIETVQKRAASPKIQARFAKQVEPAEPGVTPVQDWGYAEPGEQVVAPTKQAVGPTSQTIAPKDLRNIVVASKLEAATNAQIQTAKAALQNGEGAPIYITGSSGTRVWMVADAPGYAEAAEQLGMKTVPVDVRAGTSPVNTLIKGKVFAKPVQGAVEDWANNPSAYFKAFKTEQQVRSLQVAGPNMAMPPLPTPPEPAVGTQWGPVPMPSTWELDKMYMTDSISQHLYNEQAKYQTIMGTRPGYDTLKALTAMDWTAGKDVLPGLRFAKLGQQTMLRTTMDSAISRIGNDYMRETLTGMTQGIRRATTGEIPMQSPNFVEVIRSWGTLASGDAQFGREMANMAVNVNDPLGCRVLENTIQEAANKRFVRTSNGNWAMKVNDVLIPRKGISGGTESEMNLTPAPESAGKVLTYLDKSGRAAQVPGDTSLGKYTVKLGNDILWAKYNVKAIVVPPLDAGLVLKGLYKTRALEYQMRNLWRGSVGKVGPLMGAARNVAVGSGFVILGAKHTLTDTTRSALEEGFDVFRLKHHRGEFESTLEKLDPQTAAAVRFLRLGGMQTEEHWLESGVGKGGWAAGKLFDKERNPQFLDGNAEALRVIGQGKVFQAWAKDGLEGARKWYESPEGQKFLRTEGYARAWRRNYTGPKVLGDARKAAITNYAMDQYVGGVLEEMRVSAPHILDGYADVPGLTALADAGKLEPGAITSLVKAVGEREVNENLRLGRQVDTHGGATSTFVSATKLGMTPNRLNRDAVFLKTFSDLNKSFVKDGVDPNVAAHTSAEIAWMRSEQVHFDLAQAINFEKKYRAFAWFLTKHRLWMTYIIKQAIIRPTLIPLVQDISDWMELRNKDLNVPDYEKHNLTFSVGGKKLVTLQGAPYCWMTDQSVLSPLGSLFEMGVTGAVNAATGSNLPRSPMVAGYEATRFDKLIIALDTIVQSPWGWSGAIPFAHNANSDNVTDEQAMDWFNALKPADQRYYSGEIGKRQGMATIAGEPITWKEALGQTLASNLAREGMRFVRPSSTRTVTSEEQAYNKLNKDLWEATPEERGVMFDTNPAAKYAVGLSNTPWDKGELDDYRSRYFALQDWVSSEFTKLWDDGKIEDATAVGKIFQIRDARLDALKKDSSVFDDWYNGSNQKGIIDALQYLSPGINAAQVYKPAAQRTQAQVDQIKEYFSKLFDQKLQEYGLTDKDSAEPLYKMLRNYFVTLPQADLLFSDEISYTEQSIAGYLGRGGEDVDITRKDKYLQLMKEAHKRDLIANGIKQGEANMSDPFLATLTDQDKKDIGYNADPTAQLGWWQWAYDKKEVAREVTAAGFKLGTKEAKPFTARFEAQTKALQQQNPAFAKEYEISSLPLAQRLKKFGVGSGNDPESKLWAQFLNIAQGYQDALAGTWNATTKKYGIGPDTKGGMPVAKEYDNKVAAFIKQNPDFRNSFLMSGFTLTNFGFVCFKGSSEDLWWNKLQAPVSTEPLVFIPLNVEDRSLDQLSSLLGG